MKKIIILTLLLFLNSALLLSNNLPFEMERLSVNFQGVAFNESSLIVYGEACILLRSPDRGKSWKQYHIVSSELNINKILSFNNNYYGILSQDYLMSSNDDGQSWTKNKLEDSISFNDLAVNDDFLFILTNNSILVYNYSFQKINTVNFETSTKATEILLFNNHLLVASDSGKLIDFDIKNGFTERITDFHALGLGYVSANPSQIKYDNGNIYVTLGSYLLVSGDNGNTWTKINEGVYCFDVNDGNCYTMVSNFDYFKNISYPSFYKVSTNGREKINNDDISRYIYTMYYRNFKFINSDTVIAVGNDKLIMMSFNGGKNWEYKSNINVTAIGAYWLNEKQGYVCYSKGQVFKTIDGGTTFLPQLYADSIAKGFLTYDVKYFNESGEGLIYRSSDKIGGMNFMFTKDFGENYNTISVQKFIGTGYEFRPFIIKQDSNYIFFISGRTQKNFISEIFIFDNELSEKKYIILDSICFLNMRLNHNNKELEAIGYKRSNLKQNGMWDTVKYILMRSSDYGVTWQKKLLFETDYSHRCINYLDNKYIITTTSYDESTNIESTFISFIDPDTGMIKKEVYVGENIGGSNFKMNNKIYMGLWYFILTYDNFFKEPDKWKVDSLDIYNFYGMFWNNDLIGYGAVVDKQMKSRLMKFTIKNPTNVEETEILRTYLYSDFPYPLPASDKIHCKIYWDLRYDISNSKLSICDVSGNFIPTKEGQLQIKQNDSYFGEIIWDCHDVQNGIYLIRITHGDATRIIPVVVNR